MNYEIQSKNDLSAGACLVIRFPEEDLDRKALYTVEADCPGFLVPFRHRSIDGQIECVYQLGDRSKLLYRFGRRPTVEYVELWNSLLQPILDCEDWFLNSSSFVLETEYIYIGRDERTISYIYVPSKRPCADADALKRMAQEIADRNPVDDLDMENRVLRSIMQGFRPGEFLKMLKSASGTPERSEARRDPPPQTPNRVEPPIEAIYETPVAHAKPAEPEERPVDDRPGTGHGDIFIDLDGGKARKGKERPVKEKKRAAKEKPVKEKPVKEPRHGGLFGGRKERAEIVAGAAAVPTPAPARRPEPAAAPVYATAQSGYGEGDVTTLDSTVGLRLLSGSPLPKFIIVELEPRGIFTIGRFDTAVGVQQSSFEFDRKTMAVSRHHAAIERGENGEYTIVDLNSKAGTYVDGSKLTPNIPYKLTRGCRVSFGTGGADYMWEE